MVVLLAALGHNVFQITANIIKVIDKKLGPLPQTKMPHAQKLKKIEARTALTENRIAAAETQYKAWLCISMTLRTDAREKMSRFSVYTKTLKEATQQSLSIVGYPTCSGWRQKWVTLKSKELAAPK